MFIVVFELIIRRTITKDIVRDVRRWSDGGRGRGNSRPRKMLTGRSLIIRLHAIEVRLERKYYLHRYLLFTCYTDRS